MEAILVDDKAATPTVASPPSTCHYSGEQLGMNHSTQSSAKRLPRRSFASQPVHLRLTDLCRKAIHGGDFAAGDRFPSERELAERYDISRATANKVISSLVSEGLLELQKGIGSRVRKQRMLFASLGGMESFTAHARGRGMVPATQVLKFERQLSSGLDAAVCRGLGLDGAESNAEPVIYLERLRLADGVPMILENRWVRESLVGGLEKSDVEDSFYKILEEKFGLPMTGEHHSISAVLLDRDAAALFELSRPAAALVVEGSGLVKGDTPLWYQQLFYRGDRYQLHNETRGSGGSGLELRFGEIRASA